MLGGDMMIELMWELCGDMSGCMFGVNLKERLYKFGLEKIYKKMSLEELSRLYSVPLDSVINEKEREENLKYIGGELKMVYKENGEFICSHDLYFKTTDDKWKKYSADSKRLSMERYLKEDAIEELRTCQEIKFEIAPLT